ncbi:MAG: M48 family metalloprotease [Acidimicrobiales bacterium]
MAGPSTWWSTPSRPESHFTADELARSAAYHRPLRRAGVAGVGAKLGLLVLAGLLAPILASLVDGRSAWDSGVGLVEAVTSARVLLGTGLTVVALRLPAVLVDGWFEYRFRRGIPGYRPLPLPSFVTTATALAIGGWVVLVPIAGVGYRYAANDDGWPMMAVAVFIGVVVVVAAGERAVRQLLPGAESPLEADSPVADELAGLVDQFGLAGIGFRVGSAGGRDRDAAPNSAAAGANACAVGVGRNRRVVVTEALLAEEHSTRRFIVAHELTHLTRRHVVLRAGAAVLSAGLTGVVLVALAQAGLPWRWFDIPAADPIGLPILALVVMVVAGLLAPITAWLSRAHERTADTGAIAAVGPLDPDPARDLHLGSVADLDPPWWAKLYAQHPPPAERLEYLSRHRRAVGSSGAMSKPAAISG